MPKYESDICIIGSGLSAAMLAEKLSEKRPGVAITVVEAGAALFDSANRLNYHLRSTNYGENAWPGDNRSHTPLS
jgi:choline dehydrogenase-like flavoprotein